MSRFRLPRHGRNHRKGGSDEIPGLEGIRFDVDNEGGWLYVVANASTDIDFGALGILIDDETGDGILVRSTGGVEAEGTSVRLISGSDTLTIDSSGVTAVLPAGDKFTVKNHLGAPIFEVREDGSVHIPTGTAIIADL